MRLPAAGVPDGVGAPPAGAAGDAGGDGAGETPGCEPGGVVNTWETRRTTDAAASFGDRDVATRASEPVRRAAMPNPAVARPSDTQRRGRSSAAQRD